MASTVQVLASNEEAGIHTFEILFTAATTTEEAVVPLLANKTYTVSYFEAWLDASSATQITPALGYSAGWTVNDTGHISEYAGASAAYVLIQEPVRFVAYEGSLFVRPTPDVSGDDITIRITIQRGHKL